MTAVQNSILMQILIALRDAASALWTGSLIGGLFRRLGASIRRAAEGSWLCGFLVRRGVLVRAWPESIFCAAFLVLVNLPAIILRWIYKMWRGLFDGSVTLRLAAGAGQGAWALIGLLVLVMLVAPHASWNNTYGFLGALAVTALFYLAGATREKTRLRVDVLGPYMALYMGLIFLGLATSLSTHLSLRFFLFHLTGFLIVLLLVSSVKRYSQIHVTVALTALGLTIASLYGCYQGYMGVEVVASQQDLLLNEGMPGRVYSFFDNPNNFAEILAMLIPLLLAFFLNCKGWRGKLASALALVPCVAAIGLTYGRSSWIGLAIAVFVFLALQNWRLVPVALVLGVVSIPFLPETIINRILTIGNMQDSSARYRFAIYEATMNLLRDYWRTGVGLGSDVMKGVFRQYPTLYDGNYPIHTHNNYLQMWGEVGILGLLTYLALVFGQLKSGLHAFAAGTSRQVKNLLAAAMAGLCGILVISFAEYTWFYPRNMFLFWFLFGIIAACVKLSGKGAEA